MVYRKNFMKKIKEHPLWTLITMLILILGFIFKIIPLISGCYAEESNYLMGYNLEIPLPLQEDIKMCSSGDSFFVYNISKENDTCNHMSGQYQIDYFYLKDGQKMKEEILGNTYILERIIANNTNFLEISYEKCGFKNKLKRFFK